MSTIPDAEVIKYKVGKQTIVMPKLTIPKVYELRDKFEFDVMKLFIDTETTERSMMSLLIDTEFALKLCWYFSEKKLEYDIEKFYEEVGTAADLDEFKDAFWAAIVNFSSPHIRKTLIDVWAEGKKNLRRFKIESATSTSSSSEQSQEA